MSRIAVAMSGGVDSSVAAALLAEAGHEVIGITLQLWDYSGVNLAAGRGRCCSPADIADARVVAADVDFPHYVFDHTRAFQEQIVEPFADAYSAGLTPSPCISCNRQVKFDLLWRIAQALGADELATGHYARLEHADGRPQVRRGRDGDKDQSYFLFDVPAHLLSHVRFPLGDLDKDAVRHEAARLGLSVASKPESYELCFIPDGNKDEFVARARPEDAAREVRLETPGGDALGSTTGLHRFTVGQRRGLGISAADKLYVLGVDGDAGRVVVGAESDLYSRRLDAIRCNWLAIPEPERPFRAAAQIRHRHEKAPATLTPLPDGQVSVEFDDPQRAIAPGQGVAFYSDELLLGGGWIAALN